jgi:hypothetical protein
VEGDGAGRVEEIAFHENSRTAALPPSICFRPSRSSFYPGLR